MKDKYCGLSKVEYKMYKNLKEVISRSGATTLDKVAFKDLLHKRRMYLIDQAKKIGIIKTPEIITTTPNVQGGETQITTTPKDYGDLNPIPTVVKEFTSETGAKTEYEAFYKAAKGMTDFIKEYYNSCSGVIVVVKDGKATLYENCTKIVIPE